MKTEKDITFQSLVESEEIQIGYLDNDIVIVDSIQKFVEISTAHVSMNAIVICTEGKIHAKINGQPLNLEKNQIAVTPFNMKITDIMISPDFNLKAIFLTPRILQSFLREKINVWNEALYVHRQYIFTAKDEIRLYNHFYDIIFHFFTKEKDSPYRTDIVQSLLKAGILSIAGLMKRTLNSANNISHVKSADAHFQRFLNLLNTSAVKHRSVASFANELCISPKHLSAICKKSSGKTANDWITEQVLEEIQYYLKQTDLSIKQICDRLNFPNPSFFGKYVKTHLGMTPGDIRNSCN